MNKKDELLNGEKNCSSRVLLQILRILIIYLKQFTAFETQINCSSPVIIRYFFLFLHFYSQVGTEKRAWGFSWEETVYIQKVPELKTISMSLGMGKYRLSTSNTDHVRSISVFTFLARIYRTLNTARCLATGENARLLISSSSFVGLPLLRNRIHSNKY